MRFVFGVFVFLWAIGLPFCSMGQQTATPLIFNKTELSIHKIFDNIEESGFVVSYNTQQIPAEQLIKIPKKQLRLTDLLKHLLEVYSINSKVEKQKIIFTKKLQSYTLSGFIRDASSKETLIGAHVFVPDNVYASFSNNYGFYSITLPEGAYEITISYIGYLTKKIKLNLDGDKEEDIVLENSYNELADVVILPQKKSFTAKASEEINLQETNTLPQLLGNDDILKRLQYLPGMGGGISGFSDLLVRGGDANENLVLLDDVPVYNYNHFPGLLSVFNTEALKKVNLYKGLFPARFAGKLSSVLDIKMRDGNMEEFHAGSTIDFAIFSLFAEGPIIKNKSSFILSLRRSWVDFLSRLVDKDEKIDFHLLDLNLKGNYIIDTNNRLHLSLYTGKDKFGSNDEKIQKLAWGNKIAALRWNHIFSDKIFSNTTLSFSQFDNTRHPDETGNNETSETAKLHYKLEEVAIGTDIEYFNEHFHLKLGTKLLKNFFDLANSAATAKTVQKEQALRWVNYIENVFPFHKKLHANLGLNYIFYHHKGKNSQFFQPRLSLNYIPNSQNKFSLGFSEMRQFVHHLGPSGISLPYAFRLPSSDKLPASISNLYELNYVSSLRRAKDKLQFAVYYKKQEHILRYRFYQDLGKNQLATNWEDQVIQGKRKGFGIEASYFANLAPFECNIAYTFSDFKEKYPTINEGNYYPSALHVKHLLKTFVNYKFGKKNSHTLSLAVSYNSGQRMTLPVYTSDATATSEKIFVADRINNYKLRNNFQIDIAYTLIKKKTEYKSNILKAGVLSILGKPAPFQAYPYADDKKLKIEKGTIPFPMPYLSYTFKF